MRKGVSLLIVATLMLSCVLVFNASWTAAAPTAGKKVVFVTGTSSQAYGMGNKWVGVIQAYLTSLGHTCVNITSITSAGLSGADALIMASPYGTVGRAGFNKTAWPTICSTIKTWYDQGGKFLWVSGDSDYTETSPPVINGDWISLNASKILETVGSYLRIEPAAIGDPVSNAGGGAYRVCANVPETADDAAQITAGVVKPVLFHGPTLVYAERGGVALALETQMVPNVFNIMRSSPTAYVYEQDFKALARCATHAYGDVGSWVLMAGQKYAGPFANNKVIASGASPYGDYEPLYKDTYYSVDFDGATLVKNALVWGLNVEAQVVPVNLVGGFALVAVVLLLPVMLFLLYEKRRA